MESEGDHFLAYYLTKEDETALEFKQTRLERPVNGVQEEEVRIYASSYFSACR